LSRRSDWEIEVEKNNKDKRLLKLEWFEVRVVENKEYYSIL